MKTFIRVVGGGYFGFSLGMFGGLTFTSWEWWIILVPTIILLLAGDLFDK